MKRLFVLLAVVMLFLPGCGQSSIVEGTEITYRGEVIDRALAPVVEKPYSFMEETRAYIGIKEPNGTAHCFWEAKRKQYDWPNAFVGDTVEITVATEKRTGWTVVVELTVLEKGKRHLEWEQKQEEIP